MLRPGCHLLSPLGTSLSAWPLQAGGDGTAAVQGALMDALGNIAAGRVSVPYLQASPAPSRKIALTKLPVAVF